MDDRARAHRQHGHFKTSAAHIWPIADRPVFVAEDVAKSNTG
jgi:hypothetical protein